ncbi:MULTISPECIES: aminotransferase class III-fold pyridoxal phosphate-dependent enzyme [Pseudonocardia]|uniref:Beta-phenylalanine transaminase n=2 Tax=Pseudonocardia TaxID=1847 RepID=A0A1Y2N3R3_PSEAH|nr:MULTISPECIES: aminotransferase class III-fold pyridoxal phosphate-dependent enzyme [Pseudonocardia]OSY41737.1 Beta-phenylalanine transaminase [Pseudonocardia autotrophica]TDN71211.1 glutamate-1-semialdehyde 2,1-aminomutase [Pseudonocardia autotrophica]BBG01882.1 glutamate-1-semialdehyde 2,1-aminomutase [Pseudonocardia autotrophica]GEC23047.1 glutamate-1-semialdehyde 2,1-aminomutase [Pseudonocardia saturnea]
MQNATAAPELTHRVHELRAVYEKANPRSAERHLRARTVMPGGNTRTTLHYAPFPLVFTGAAGATLRSLDGDDYLDLLGDFTAGLYGHSHPVLRAALNRAVDAGTTFGGHNDDEDSFVAELVRRFPSLELARLTNSGTEANTLALAAAVAHTGRSTILVFRGGYHGGVLDFTAPQRPLNLPHRFRVCDYADPAAAAAAIRECGEDLAAVLVEPMQGSAGCIPADPELLRTVRAATAEVGALLVFDEVMTSRLGPGGLQQELGITPDLTTLGKYLGGGMTFGAFGGRADIMRRFDPGVPGAWGHPGTFNNNTLTVAAGLAGLVQVLTPEVLADLNTRGDRLRGRLVELFRAADLPFTATGSGSLMTIHPVRGPVRSVADLAAADDQLRELLFLHLLGERIWIARRGFIALTLAVTDADCDALVASVDRFAHRHGDTVRRHAGR